MEQIAKKDGRYFYGQEECRSVERAYEKFRDDYHKSLGTTAYRRLDRCGQRKERVHDFGFIFADKKKSSLPSKRYTYYLLGLVGISYCRIIGCWEYRDICDERFDEWFDAVFSQHSGFLRMAGTNVKSGRTSKNKKKRYR